MKTFQVTMARGQTVEAALEVLQMWQRGELPTFSPEAALFNGAIAIDGKHPSHYRHDPQGTGLLIAHPKGTWMCQRIYPGDQFENYWCYYGGTVEPFENPFTSVVREVKEETGLEFDPNAVEHVLTGEYIKPVNNMQFWAHLMAVKLENEDAVLQRREVEKHGPPTLVPWEEIGNLKIMPVMRDAWDKGLIAAIRQKYYPNHAK